MFCALKGTTAWPARAKLRQSAVTTTLLPTSDAVPITISDFALITTPKRRHPSNVSLECQLYTGDEIDPRRWKTKVFLVMTVKGVLHPGDDLLVLQQLPLEPRPVGEGEIDPMIGVVIGDHPVGLDIVAVADEGVQHRGGDLVAAAQEILMDELGVGFGRPLRHAQRLHLE